MNNNHYDILFTEEFKKSLKKLDKQNVKLIRNWIRKNLLDTNDPRIKGKALAGNLKGVWRYRVGDYRLFATIEDNKFIVFLFEVGHRKDSENT
ncbi:MULTISPECIES: type II toxin-antitoxin system RelE/ParE family toxin [unclassified Gemella]|uniref:type II toxin-antitoxin system RelE family toxin n=1 Tax=unclassified Gemella TaxID=2624949 RepID=UPI001073ACF7|nr:MULTISPECIES: type II toxin-antitoxin system RelE/ParE family toxin [unclassified Gemella]MBF0710169.1 type II toxin-antitoxin system RelE/ParE family toxin [Gemella sp. GL1.1]MBF0746470.1 type II toxin-antitoxin system RelE/ParE family toxin [Gemella sp. 19428wG2_WT2a]NYS27513.1 type II toxin-antitoxin system RelE/ParE family toxin [Gemella sp. GL1]TFU60250.1 type II toxin-antitoxin system RelE/ParE family toxin [Gemella sp. WT2a]